MSTSKNVSRLLLLVGALSVLGLGMGGAACAPALAPVYQVNGAGLVPLTGQALSDQEARVILIRALATKQWLLRGEQAGVIFAEQAHKGHRATVRVDYNAAGYSISLVEASPGLSYDGANIHRRYNHWVHSLSDAIQREVVQIGADAGAAAAAGAPAPVVPAPVVPAPVVPAPVAPAPVPVAPAPASPAPAAASPLAPSGLAPVAPPAPAPAPQR